jgi:peroxiredoxin
MSETPSTMLPLGTIAPSFRLPDPHGKSVSSDQFNRAPAMLVAFICNHCPYVKHIRNAFSNLASEYQARGVAVVAINSNDADKYPDDSPEKMAEEIQLAGYTFPYLYDETQDVARAYHAACTPDFFLFDKDQCLVYRGQFDDSRPKNGRAVTGEDMRCLERRARRPLAQRRPKAQRRLQHQMARRPSHLRPLSRTRQAKPRFACRSGLTRSLRKPRGLCGGSPARSKFEHAHSNPSFECRAFFERATLARPRPRRTLRMNNFAFRDPL